MFKAINGALKKQWTRLSTYSGSRRLSLFSLIMLLGLDIFVLSLLYNGLQEASLTIKYPALAISDGCKAMTEDFLQQDAAGKAASLRGFVVVDPNNHYDVMHANGFSDNEKLSSCSKVRSKLLTYSNNASLSTLYLEFDKLRGNRSSIYSEIAELKSSYDSALLEKAAGQKRQNSILPAEATTIKSVIALKTSQVTELEKKLAAMSREIDNHPLILEYTGFLNVLPYATEFAKARAEYDQQLFWFPIKTLCAELLFLLPLLLITIFWNLRAMKVQNPIQTLISSHLILVCAIPVFTRIAYFVYDILPHQLLSNLIAILQELNLGFIWTYIAIIGSIAVGLVVIAMAQRTFFSPARQRVTRLRKTLCRDCGEQLHAADQAWCEFCGAEQMAICGHCGEPHRLLAFHCEHCGEASDIATAK